MADRQRQKSCAPNSAKYVTQRDFTSAVFIHPNLGTNGIAGDSFSRAGEHFQRNNYQFAQGRRPQRSPSLDNNMHIFCLRSVARVFYHSAAAEDLQSEQTSPHQRHKRFHCPFNAEWAEKVGGN